VVLQLLVGYVSAATGPQPIAVVNRFEKISYFSHFVHWKKMRKFSSFSRKKEKIAATTLEVFAEFFLTN